MSVSEFAGCDFSDVAEWHGSPSKRVCVCVCGGRGKESYYGMPVRYLGVDVHVLLQADGVAEGLAADAAAEGSRAAVGPPHVDLQAVGRREHLQTDRQDTGSQPVEP